ncbi:MAG TPA: hypothetical protein VFY24_02660 [Azospira sp.]|nr:hypothetical protein [Azospira sp.]
MKPRRRPLLAVAALSLALLASLPLPAAARDGWPFAQDRGQRERQVAPQRQDAWRDSRRDDARQAPQRLSPDERRQLRRDLHDANRDMPSRRGNSRR